MSIYSEQRTFPIVFLLLTTGNITLTTTVTGQGVLRDDIITQLDNPPTQISLISDLTGAICKVQGSSYVYGATNLMNIH
jgi:hypothetical protein